MRPQCARRTLEFMTNSSHSRDPQATRSGPSWVVMLFLIALAMLIATGIAWAFVTPALHRHF
jgi:hypothetical protein